MIEAVAYWVAFSAICLVLVSAAGALVLRTPRLETISMGLGWTAFGALSASITARWLAAGHPPIFGTYENSLAAVWFLLAFSLAAGMRLPALRKALLVAMPWAIVILMWGVRFNRHRIPLTISERSLWVDVHATFAWFAYGSLSLAAGLSLVYFVRQRRNQAGRPPGWTGSFPEPDVLDEWVMRYIAFGFVNLTVMMGAGMWYSWLLFGSWWKWDLVETTTLIVWLLYGLVIHLKLFFGWRGIRLHAICLVALLGILFAFWGMTFFPGISYHVFDLGF